MINKKTNLILQTFIIDTVLIMPIKDIIFKLENKQFRGCDIEWLNNKLYKFTKFAVETLGKKFNNAELVSDDGNLNEYKTEQLLIAFRILLNYYESL